MNASQQQTPFRLLLALALLVPVPGCWLLGQSPSGSTSSSSGPPPVLVDGAPKIPAAFGKAAFFMPREEAAKTEPMLVKSGSIGEKRYAGMSFFTSWMHDRLDSVYVSFDEGYHTTAVKSATDAWGKPMEGSHLDYPFVAWFNDELGVRARIELEKETRLPKSIQFEPYIPIAQLWADDTEPFLMPILGKTKDELKDLHPSARWADEHVDLAGDQYDTSPFMRVQLDFNDEGKIEGYYYGMAFGDLPEAKDIILEALRERYGKGKETDKGWMIREEPPSIFVRHDDISDAWEISVAREVY